MVLLPVLEKHLWPAAGLEGLRTATLAVRVVEMALGAGTPSEDSSVVGDMWLAVGTMKSVAGDKQWTGDSEEEPVRNIADHTAVAVAAAVKAPGSDSYTGLVAAAVAMILV